MIVSLFPVNAIWVNSYGKKTMENEILKEAVEYGRAKKWIAHAPLLPGDDD